MLFEEDWYGAYSTCLSCGYVYDPDEGDPDGGIPAGTEFEDIPDNWFCPVCGARKADFEPLD